MTNPPCELLAWDSDFFGVRIARLAGLQLNPTLAAAVRDWVREHQVECLYLLLDANDTDSRRIAERQGCFLTDLRITFERTFDASTPDRDGPGLVRPMVKEDLPAALSLARSVHGESRFFADPHFNRARCHDLYEAWLHNSFHGFADAVLVAEVAGEIAGYVTGNRREGNSGVIGLVGVGEPARGQGVGRALLDAAHAWFIGQACRRAQVATQGGNIAAQRLYQACGYRTISMQLWYHWWPREQG